jgi:hypothetical protein
MKKFRFLTAILIVLFTSCKKTEYEPLGPTDIRIRNLSDVTMVDVTVNTSGGEFNYGAIDAGATSDYYRFEKAYPKANISAIINGEQYRTDTAIYTWMQYLGQMKATYEIYIKSEALRQLEIFNVVPESGLK